MSEQLLTVTEVADKLNISRSAVYRLFETGALKSLKPTPHTRRVDRGDLDTYLQKRKRAA